MSLLVQNKFVSANTIYLKIFNISMQHIQGLFTSVYNEITNEIMNDISLLTSGKFPVGY